MGHVDVDQRAVVEDLALGGMDEAHPAHIGSQLVDLVKAAIGQRQRFAAVLLQAQVAAPENHRQRWG